MEQLPLFVFGTLCRGQCNHHFLAGHYARMVPARLNGFARVNPLMIAPRADAEVRGELFFLQAGDYTVTMRDCDILEGIPAGRTRGMIYSRVRVNVQTSGETLTAWAYVQSGDETA